MSSYISNKLPPSDKTQFNDLTDADAQINHPMTNAGTPCNMKERRDVGLLHHPNQHGSRSHHNVGAPTLNETISFMLWNGVRIAISDVCDVYLLSLNHLYGDFCGLRCQKKVQHHQSRPL